MKHLGNDAVQVDHVKEMHEDLHTLGRSMHISLEENSQLVETSIRKTNVVTIMLATNTSVLVVILGMILYSMLSA